MRYTRTACASVLAMALAVGAAPALAADDGAAQRQGAASAKLSRVTSAAPQGDPRFLWEDRLTCPQGQRAVWVDRAWIPPKLYIDPHTGEITFEPAKQAFHGWECQPLTLRPFEP